MRRGGFPALRDTEQARAEAAANREFILGIVILIGVFVLVSIIAGTNCSHGRC